MVITTGPYKNVIRPSTLYNYARVIINVKMEGTLNIRKTITNNALLNIYYDTQMARFHHTGIFVEF